MKASYDGVTFEGTPGEVVKAIVLYIVSAKGKVASPSHERCTIPPCGFVSKPSATLAQIFALDDELMRMKL